jgi:hypothetical protein
MISLGLLAGLLLSARTAFSRDVILPKGHQPLGFVRAAEAIVRASPIAYDDGASEEKYRFGSRSTLRTKSGSYTARWNPLEPLNEQVRGEDDPWLGWVRANSRK